VKLTPEFEWQIDIQEYFAVEVEFRDPPDIEAAISPKVFVEVALPTLDEVLPCSNGEDPQEAGPRGHTP
jgi:hypothetical protein